jgi:hypothetical protein
MTTFKCLRCEYTSIYKKDVKKHLNKKKTCKIELLDIDRDKCIKILGESEKDIIKAMEEQIKKLRQINVLQEKDIQLKELNEKIKIQQEEINNLKLNQNNVHEDQSECIYLLLEREFITKPIKIVKLGRSACFKNRMGNYPKGSKILYTSKCEDSIKAEKDLLMIFSGMFKHRSDAGKEYFEGNTSQMIKQIQGYFYNQ